MVLKKYVMHVSEYVNNNPNVMIFLLLVFGGFLRIYGLENYPGLSLDEARASYNAKQIVLGLNYPLTSFQRINHAILGQYLIALSMILFGKTLFGSRLLLSFFDIFSAIILYFWCKKNFSKRQAIIFVLLFMTTSYFVVTSHYPNSANLGRLTFSLFVLSLFRMLKKPTKKSFFLFGLTYGLVMQTHAVSLLVILPALLFLIKKKGLSFLFNKNLIFFFNLVESFSRRGVGVVLNPLGNTDSSSFITKLNKACDTFISLVSELFPLNAFFAKSNYLGDNLLFRTYLNKQYPFNTALGLVKGNYLFLFFLLIPFVLLVKKETKWFFIFHIIISITIIALVSPTISPRYLSEVMLSSLVLLSCSLDYLLNRGGIISLLIVLLTCLFVSQQVIGFFTAYDYFQKFGYHFYYTEKIKDVVELLENKTRKEDVIVSEQK